MFKKTAAIIALAVLSSGASADVMLGTYNFNSSTFGNTLTESDGGLWSGNHWINTSNVNPGNPGYLTGANFNTGISNIGLVGSPPVYGIGYGTPIVNGAGADLGIVTLHGSLTDTIRMDVSEDGGSTYAGFLSFAPALANSTGVTYAIIFTGGIQNPSEVELFVTEVDLSDYGIALGGSINFVRVSGSPELDLLRVAGFGDPNVVSEPGSLALAGLGGLVFAALRRRATRT
jgi:hypothetical protein